MIEIKKATNQISNCNVCGAINFNSELSMNRKVDNLTEILIGRSLSQQVTLCDDCLRELLKKITDYIFPNHGDLIDRDKIKFIEYINGDVTVSKEVVMNQPVIIQANIDKT